MWPVIGGAVLGGAIGGYFNNEAQKSANASNAEINETNIHVQREFAKNGLRWRIDDAASRGIHPLMAIGAQPTSFSPSSIGVTPNTSWGDAISDMGQNVSRAMGATRTQQERDLATLQIQGAKLDNLSKEADVMLKQQAIQRAANPGNPAFPGDQNFIPGQGNTSGPGKISNKPLERTTSASGRPYMEPGTINDVGYAKTKTGVKPIPSGDIKNRIEDNTMHELSHYWRNNVTPNFGSDDSKPPIEALPRGAKDWKWSYTKQEWQPMYTRKVYGGEEYRRENF